MNVPAVSIIIPVYIRAQLVGRAVQSVSAQSFQDYEFILGNDGSSDDLAGALGGMNDPRLRGNHSMNFSTSMTAPIRWYF